MESKFSVDIQKLFLEIMISDAESFVRVQNIYNPKNFHKSLFSAAKFLQEYSVKYNSVPSEAQIRAQTGSKLEKIDDLDESMIDWFMDQFEEFTKHEELVRAILKSSDMIQKGEYGPVEALIKSAVQISLTKDMGINYFDEPKDRIEETRRNNGQISTGWKDLDYKLFGGMNKGELNIFAGGSGSGKSLFMHNLCVNWLNQQMNGLYITLELSEAQSALRIDSIITGKSVMEIFKDIDNIELLIKTKQKGMGSLQLKYLPAQSNVNDLRSYVREYQIKTGIKVDYICVDYLDLLMPVSARVSPSDLFVKDKYVSEELRNLAKELNVILVTASQLNRSAVEEVEFDHSHISGGLSKINTADNVFGIFTSRSMRENGKYQLQLMKTRNSNGVGLKIDLSYDMESLKISDAPDQSQNVNGTKNVSDVIKKIQNKSTSSSSDDEVPAPKASTQSTKLKNMLAGLKSQSQNDL